MDLGYHQISRLANHQDSGRGVVSDRAIGVWLHHGYLRTVFVRSVGDETGVTASEPLGKHPGGIGIDIR